MKNTKINYMYRDASNYKAHRTEILSGTMSEGQITVIKREADGDGFIPSQVGLDNLQEELMDYDTKGDNYDPFGENGDDHVWHEINEIELTDEEPTVSITAKDFFKLFAKAINSGWEIQDAMKEIMA